MKLSVRISLVIWLLSLVISTVFAFANYQYQLQQATKQYQYLTSQLAQTASNTSAIAAYLADTELAQQVVDGLVENDLVTAASINVPSENLMISAGLSLQQSQAININLNNPFFEEEIIGRLTVIPNAQFIRGQVTSSALQNAYLLMGLGFILAVAVGLFVRSKLTQPIKKLADAVTLVDPSTPEFNSPINIGYKQKDEISALAHKTNGLIGALKQQFMSERELREETEELQKRFRLLFEQATAGIALLSNEGDITIGNPAFFQLFGEEVEGQSFANLFESPGLVKKQINLLSDDNEDSQVDIDLIYLQNEEKRYLHCLFSSISDARKAERNDSKQLVEVIIYDITHRKTEEVKARYEADHDSLTGLLNRRSGSIKLNELLKEQYEHKSTFALMMIDLDKFKPINDTYGHDVGDDVLQAISARLLKGTEEEDRTPVNIRWGGDEFIIGLRLNDTNLLPAYTERLIEMISAPIEINDDLQVKVGASVGVIILEPEQQSENEVLEALITRADELMYETKQQNAKRYTIVKYQASSD